MLANLHCVDVGQYQVVLTSPTINCFSYNYKWWLFWLYPLLLFPVAGFPIMVFAIMLKMRERFRVIREKQERHEQLTPFEAGFHRRYGILCTTYRTGMFFWETVALVRRTMLIVLSVALWKYHFYRSQSYVVLCLVVLMAQVCAALLVLGCVRSHFFSFARCSRCLSQRQWTMCWKLPRCFSWPSLPRCSRAWRRRTTPSRRRC